MSAAPVIYEFDSDDPVCEVRITREHADLYVLTIATERVDGVIPPLDATAHPQVHYEQMAARRQFLTQAKRVPLGLPLAGCKLVYGTLEALEASLRVLAWEGYRVPPQVLDAVRAAARGERADG